MTEGETIRRRVMDDDNNGKKHNNQLMRGCNGDGNGMTTTMTTTTLTATMTTLTTTTTTAAVTANVAASVTAMAGPHTTINLSYRNGGGCSWATAGRRLCNVNGKGDNGGNGDSDDGVRSEEAMLPHLLTPARGGAMMMTMRRALHLVEE